MSATTERGGTTVFRGTLTRLARAQQWLERRPLITLALVIALMTAIIAAELVKRYDANRSPQGWALAQRLLSQDPAGRPAAQERQSPGYSVIIALAASVDPSLKTEITCGRGTGCVATSPKSLLMLQFLIVLVGLLAAGGAAYVISGNQSVGFLTLLLTFAGSSHGEPMSYFADYVWVTSLIYIQALVTVLTWRWSSLAMSVLSGGLLGVLVLLKPLLIVAVPVFAVLLASALSRSWGRAWLVGAAVLIGASSALGLAYARLVVPGHYELSIALREVMFDISLRAGFQSVSLPQAVTGALLPVPLIGGLVSLLAPTQWVQPFGPFVAGTFATYGSTTIYPAVVGFGSDVIVQFRKLLDLMTSQPGGYLLSVPFLAMRSLFGKTDLVGLVGVFHLYRAVAYWRVDQRLLLVAAALVPSIVLLLASASVTATLPFTNSHMAFVFAFAISYVRGRL